MRIAVNALKRFIESAERSKLVPEATVRAALIKDAQALI
jgi:hypothetical protein